MVWLRMEPGNLGNVTPVILGSYTPDSNRRTWGFRGVAPPGVIAAVGEGGRRPPNRAKWLGGRGGI